MKFEVALQHCWQLRIFLSFIKWLQHMSLDWFFLFFSDDRICFILYLLFWKKKKCRVQKYSWLSHEKLSFGSFSESGGRVCIYLYRCICIGYFDLSGWHLGSPCYEMELHTGDNFILKTLKIAKLSYREYEKSGKNTAQEKMILCYSCMKKYYIILWEEIPQTD